MTSHPGKQIITINMLADIPQTKVNQTIKVGQIIEYHVRDNFLQILCRK